MSTHNLYFGQVILMSTHNICPHRELCKVSTEPCREKTCLWGLQPGKTQTGLLNYRLARIFEILDLTSIDIVLSRH